MNKSNEYIIEAKDRGLFNKIAKKYAEKDTILSCSLPRKYQLMFALRPFLKNNQSFDRIIEIACGVGAPAKYLKGFYKSYLGIDYSAELIKAAKAFNQGNKNAEFLVANIKNVDLNKIGAGADLVLANGALHHITELDKAIASLKKIAKPGSYFIGIEPQKGNLFFQFLRYLRGKIDKNYSQEQVYFSKKELKLIFEKHNFQEINIEFQGFFSTPFAQVIMGPQKIFLSVAKIAIMLDKLLDKYMPCFLKFLSWNIIIRAKFP